MEVIEHQTEVARLRRIHSWNATRANYHNGRAGILEQRKDARAQYARLRAKEFAAVAEKTLEQLERVEHAFNSPGVFTRLKRFLFNK